MIARLRAQVQASMPNTPKEWAAMGPGGVARLEGRMKAMMAAEAITQEEVRLKGAAELEHKVKMEQARMALRNATRVREKAEGAVDLNRYGRARAEQIGAEDTPALRSALAAGARVNRQAVDNTLKDANPSRGLGSGRLPPGPERGVVLADEEHAKRERARENLLALPLERREAMYEAKYAAEVERIRSRHEKAGTDPEADMDELAARLGAEFGL